ncbi:MAG: hypothetical protein ACFFDN_50915 [Candidatus Hodarchaeota archaeon]
MSIKIEETIKRQCCTQKDLKEYKGKYDKIIWGDRAKISFCIYCGQVWLHDREMGPAGSMEPCLTKLVIGRREE